MPSIVPETPDAQLPDGACAPCLASTGTKRYCAPARCYCGHRECPAFDSWVDLAAQPVTDVAESPRPRGTSWNDREGATWIDKM